jgi:hypothetical protein
MSDNFFESKLYRLQSCFTPFPPFFPPFSPLSPPPFSPLYRILIPRGGWWRSGCARVCGCDEICDWRQVNDCAIFLTNQSNQGPVNSNCPVTTECDADIIERSVFERSARRDVRERVRRRA